VGFDLLVEIGDERLDRRLVLAQVLMVYLAG
jgi:hypothetical protein